MSCLAVGLQPRTPWFWEFSRAIFAERVAIAATAPPAAQLPERVLPRGLPIAGSAAAICG